MYIEKMPCYKTHCRFNTLLALPIFLLGLWYFSETSLPYLLAFGSLFLYATFFLSPDLDLAHKYKLFSLRGLLTLPFRPYALFFKHRGLSHHPLFGTLTRILWLVGLCLVAGYFFSWNKEHFFSFWEEHYSYLIYGLGGIAAADLSHLFLDRLNSLKIH
jgi:uncharacterized metal-binding protein